jgi:pimeloyl-ACP methyl ester carboxylesterase
MVFMLIHSPLVGPFTWSLVAEELHARDREVIVPTLSDAEGSAAPYWQQYATIVAHRLTAVPRDRSVHWIGHSGAGPLLPALRQAVPHPVASYVFVDAGIPRNGASYLDLLATELPDQVAALRQMLQAGERFPNWNEAMLHPLIPDPERLRSMLAELHPRPLAFFAAPIPVFPTWPDAPCYYLQLSAAYETSAAQARHRGWASSAIKAGHFHMLVEPVAVTDAIVQLLAGRRTS